MSNQKVTPIGNTKLKGIYLAYAEGGKGESSGRVQCGEHKVDDSFASAIITLEYAPC